MNFSDNCLQRLQSQASVTGSQLQGKTPHNSKRFWVQPYLVSLSLSLSLKHCWAFRLQREPTSPGRRWLGSLYHPPPQAGWILIIALLAAASLVPSAKGLLAVAGGWALASEGLCASDVSLVVSESHQKEAWGCTLAPSEPERRWARTSPTLPLGSYRSWGSGAAAALSNYGWHWHNLEHHSPPCVCFIFLKIDGTHFLKVFLYCSFIL